MGAEALSAIQRDYKLCKKNQIFLQTNHKACSSAYVNQAYVYNFQTILWNMSKVVCTNINAFMNLVYQQYLWCPVSYHQLLLAALVVPQHRDPVAEAALLAEVLQRRRKQCCQGSLSAPLWQQQGEQLNGCNLWRKMNALQENIPPIKGWVESNTWGLVLAQAKSRNDILVDLVLVF